MLTVTDDATSLVRDLVATGSDGSPADGGAASGDAPVLRLAPDEGGELHLSLAPGALEGDQVVEAAGGLLVIEGQTAELVSDALLDTAATDDGPEFVLSTPSE